MTTAYSPFFASGLLATSYYASGSDFFVSTKSNQIRIDETRLVAKTPTSSSLARFNFTQAPTRAPSSTSDTSTTSPLSVSRHRRRRSSLSAAMSITLPGIKTSARDAAATRCYATLGATASPQRRANGGSFSASSDVENSAPPSGLSAAASSDAPKRSRTLRRSTVTAALSPLRLKRSDRRGPSPVPPPSSPLPPVPPLPPV